MSEVGSNSSAEEISAEEIGEIQDSTEPKPTEEAVGDPPIEVLSPADPTTTTQTADSSKEGSAAPAVDESQPPPAVQNEADVEEVARPPPVEPPVGRAGPVVAAGAGGAADDDDEEDEDIDETLTERLIGLTEMFPECVRNGTVSLVKGSYGMTKSLYGYSRSAAWIFFSTASILIMPIMIETERLSIMDQQKQQKAQMLLGPGVAGPGAGPSLGPPPI